MNTSFVVVPLMLAGISTAFLSSRPAPPASPSKAPVTQVTPPVPIPDGFLRDPSEWSSIPITDEDPAGALDCTAGTDCAKAWDNIIVWAEKYDDMGIDPDINNNNNKHDVVTLACALAWRGSDDSTWRTRCRNLIEEFVDDSYQNVDKSALAPGRNLLSYVLAANTIDLESFDSTLDGEFRSWIVGISETEQWEGDGADGSFQDYHERRPNNIGHVVGASRLAVDMYLGGFSHNNHIKLAKRVYRGFLGHDGSYNFDDGDFGGSFGSEDNSWQYDEDVGDKEGINPLDAEKDDKDIDGCLPDDMRRLNASDCGVCGSNPSFPTCYNRAGSDDGAGIDGTNYVWEALQGLVMQAYLLDRCGFDAFGWENSAIERTHRFLYVTYGLRAQDTWDDSGESDNPACCDGSGNRDNVDDTWVPHIIEAIYDSTFLDSSNLVFGGEPGKNCGFADWWTIGL